MSLLIGAGYPAIGVAADKVPHHDSGVEEQDIREVGRPVGHRRTEVEEHIGHTVREAAGNEERHLFPTHRAAEGYLSLMSGILNLSTEKAGGKKVTL